LRPQRLIHCGKLFEVLLIVVKLELYLSLIRRKFRLQELNQFFLLSQGSPEVVNLGLL
jgi:hypothetical protein